MTDQPLPRPPLVLIVTPHEWSARSIESVVASAGYAVLRAFNAEQALERAKGADPDIVMVDVDLGDMSGYQLIQRLRSDMLVTPATPILMTTGSVPTEADLLRALEAGAWELIGLPLKLEILLLKLKAFARAKLELDHVREQSLIDERSGFYNTRGMVRRVNEIALDAARHHLPITCVVFAVEPEADVKQVEPASESGATSPEPTDAPAAPDPNDDVITGRITERFRATIRASDAVGRLGEREFVVLAPHTDPEGARRMAERITRSTISATSGEGMDVRFRVRAGCYAVSDFSAALVEPVEVLMRATRALRRSQADLGGSPIEFYTEHPESTTSGNGADGEDAE